MKVGGAETGSAGSHLALPPEPGWQPGRRGRCGPASRRDVGCGWQERGPQGTAGAARGEGEGRVEGRAYRPRGGTTAFLARSGLPSQIPRGCRSDGVRDGSVGRERPSRRRCLCPAKHRGGVGREGNGSSFTCLTCSALGHVLLWQKQEQTGSVLTVQAGVFCFDKR